MNKKSNKLNFVIKANFLVSTLKALVNLMFFCNFNPENLPKVSFKIFLACIRRKKAFWLQAN